MSRRLRAALVMPARNEEQAVEATLDAVFASSRLPDEIIVADGLSTDRTVERLARYRGRPVPVRVVTNPTIYSGGGRNRGIASTDCEVILLADFGNRVDSKWVEEMLRPFEEQEAIDMVAGLLRPLVTSDFEHCMAAIHYYDEYVLDRYTSEQRVALLPEVIVPGGGSLAITRRLWERVGGFPEWLPRAQDKLFSRKAHGLGARVHVAWPACIEHHIRSTPWQVFRQLFSYGRGNGQSRYVDRHALKLAAVYGLLLTLGGGALVAPPLGGLTILLMAAYYYRAGLRRVIRVDGTLRKPRYLWLTAAVLFPRDLGTLLGHLVGWLEWFVVPRYRERFRAYTRGCSGLALFLVSE